jgi:hypothetical protein
MAVTFFQALMGSKIPETVGTARGGSFAGLATASGYGFSASCPANP